MARGRGCRYSRPTDWCFRCSLFHRAQARGRHTSSPGAASRPRSSSYTWSKGPTYPNYHPLQNVKHKIIKITISIRYVISRCLTIRLHHWTLKGHVCKPFVTLICEYLHTLECCRLWTLRNPRCNFCLRVLESADCKIEVVEKFRHRRFSYMWTMQPNQ